MTRKQTSAKVSKLAARYLGMTLADLDRVLAEGENAALLKDIRTLAASCLSQDEVKGRGKLPKFTKAEQAALERGEVVFRTEKPTKKVKA